jgi:hypothetical protein
LATIVLAACAIAVIGSLMSIVCTAIADKLTGSGYVVTPGGGF